MPLAYSIRLRLQHHEDILSRAARQSALAALFLVLCTWLRIIDELNWGNAALMLVLFVLTDALLAARENR